MSAKPSGMEELDLRTDDGWNLCLFRYPSPGAPILFVHGMGANHFNFDLNDRHSLAQVSARAGYDAWVVELRGRGSSHREPAAEKEDWNFEDFLHRDLHRAVSCIREQTGRPFHWVGHSMGGILGAAYVECYGSADVRSLTLFGTPLGFGREQVALRLWGLAAQVHRLVPTMDQEKWGRRILPLMRQNPESMKFFLRFLANPDNIDIPTVNDIFKKVVTNEAPGITLQFADWVRSGEVRSADKSFSYTQHLDRVTVPTLFISGVNDLMAPAENTTRQKDRLGAKLVRQVILSRENGYSADYGHGDLLMGRRAPEEVFPVVLRWLQEVEELSA